MHDGLGSSLVSALRVVEHGRIGEAEIAQLLKSCIDDLKLTIDSMEPVETDLLLLLGTLRFRLQPRLEATGIRLRWEVVDLPPLVWLDQRHSLHILRILQEAFTNVIKHASATEIILRTVVEKEHARVEIIDNGGGFDPAGNIQGRGLGNQARRADAIGGAIELTSGPQGTIFALLLPIEMAESGTPPD
jgi:signal transduction histidine kinase